MTYPQQPGYPSPYGQQPPGRQQNSLWLIGGSIVVVLGIIMAVVLIVVQQSQGSSNSADDGDSGRDTDHTDMEATEFKSEACAEFDLSQFEEATGEAIDADAGSASSSSSSSYDNVSCSFYTIESYNYLYAAFYDYETPDEVTTFIEYDESYAEDADYEYSEYTAYGDAGSVYTNIEDPSAYMTYLHVALGSLEVSISASYDSTQIDKDAVIAALEDLVKQSDVLFADYT